MTNFTERAVPSITANFLMKEAESRYEFAKKHIQKDSVVLDLACGTGYGSQVLRNKYSQYIGVDISEEALVYAQSRYSNAHAAFLQMDVNKTIFRDIAFNAITAFEMIEHLEKPHIFLKEAKRILNNKGLFIVSTPNRLIQSPDGTPMSPYHTKEYSPSEFLSLLKKHFSFVQMYGQRKNKKAEQSVEKFMASQTIRQLLVNCDVLGVRHLFDRDLKEKLWKHIGHAAGRGAQEQVNTTDFLFNTTKLDSAEYLIAICKK